MEERLIVLEKKSAFQEHLLEQFNEILIALRQDMERLEREVKACKDQGDLVKRREDEEPPPHY